MDLNELIWLRQNIHKLDKNLRTQIIGQHRTLSKMPCYFHKPLRYLNDKFRTLPVIIQYELLREDPDIIQSKLKKHTRRQESLKIINAVSADISLNQLKKIIDHSAVMKIYLDREVNTLLDVAVPVVSADRVWEQNYTGKNTTIAIIDTGIQEHPDFVMPMNRIIAFQDFVNNKTSPYDDNGHGTHCAGTAAGNGHASGGKYKGPAYEAKLVVIKTLDKMGSGKSSTVIRGLEWCLNNKEKYGINVASLSFGYKATSSYREDPVCQAVEKLWNEGIVLCAASGNEGPDTKTVNSPGIHPAIITVGASDDKNTSQLKDDIIADFSSRGPTPDGLTKPDLLAPGTNIVAPLAKSSYLDMTSLNVSDNSLYISLSGTSMSTPICAGVAAQLLEAKPDLTPQQLKEALLKNCDKITTADANTQGSGCINAFKALRAIRPV